MTLQKYEIRFYPPPTKGIAPQPMLTAYYDTDSLMDAIKWVGWTFDNHSRCRGAVSVVIRGPSTEGGTDK